MPFGGRIGRLLVAAFAFASMAPAYYHFLHYPSRSVFRPMPEKFDLNALPNRTLSYFISDRTSVTLDRNDNYAGLISQIKAAGQVWNDVESSDLRLAFGGITSPGAPQTAASLEVLFDEVPPGLVAMGGPTVRADSNGLFIPILKSVVILQPDLSNRPSFSEAFFNTLVHEFGHALGLQHTLTSSVMSTVYTRSTSRARPLTTDDVAAISVLYPRPSFTATTGSIAGRVTMGGASVNLASVVAIAPNGDAVSTLTHPDGTYRIDGLPPRNYYVYVHPLPPPRPGQATPADIVNPLDAEGRPFPVGMPFNTVFYPGVNDPQRAFPVAVAAGSPSFNINFDVRQRSNYGIHSVETYAFPGTFAVKAPYLSPGILRPMVVATGSGLTQGNAPTPGLTVSVLGGQVLSVRPYASAPDNYIQLDFSQQTLLVAPDGPRHLVFSANNDIYVLPSAYFHVDKLPPSITAIAQGLDGGVRAAMIAGINLSNETRIFFDGVRAAVRGVEDGRMTVIPPPAPPGHRAVVTALNTDGQSSLFVQGDNAPAFTYPGDAGAASASILAAAPGALPPGVEAMIQIDGANTSFTEGQTSIGFGTSDIVVRRLWVVSPTRLLANIFVSPAAAHGQFHVTVVSGLHLYRQDSAFMVQAPAPRPFWLMSTVMNATAQGQTSVSAGSFATVTAGVAPAPLTTGNTIVHFNDRTLPAVSVNGLQVTFQIPSGTPLGPAVVRLETGGERSLPIAISIDPPPPRIVSASVGGNSPLLELKVADLERMGVVVDPSRMSVNVSGQDVRVAQVLEQSGAHQVLVRLPAAATGPVQVTVGIDNRTSEPVNVSIP